MAYKKDQGRYARMTAFWALFLLMGYGCFTGLVTQLRNWGVTSKPYVQDLPLLGSVDLAMAITLGTLAVSGILIYKLLNQPKLADLLIDTETEMRRVTWPTPSDTWNGTIAVVVTVTILLFYLFFADHLLGYVLTKFMGGTS